MLNNKKLYKAPIKENNKNKIKRNNKAIKNNKHIRNKSKKSKKSKVKIHRK